MIGQLYLAFARAAESLQTPFLLLVRLYWGWQFMQTGWGKLHHLEKVTSFFASLNLPAPAFTAVMIGTLEFTGGILLILGLGSRLIGLLLSVNMMMAYITADREALASIIQDPGKFYNADPFTFLMASLIVLSFGAGALSIDHLLQKRFGQKRIWAQPSPAIK